MTTRAADLLRQTRDDFPLLQRCVDDHPIIHLDSGSTAPKPRCVIEAVTHFYNSCTANVHRGVHGLSEEATELYESARHEVASFLNASPDEIIFTRNTTEAINLIANGFSSAPGREIILPATEHHSNFMPWRVHAKPVVVEIGATGLPDYGALERLITPATALVALAQVSNTLGVIAPAEEWIAIAHRHGLPVLVDASQSASHIPIDVRKLDCDYLVFSGHKLLGPSGVGVLYGKRERLQELPLYQTGGGMVKWHGDDHFIAHDIPQRFEAGTPNIEGVIGLGAAVRYLRALGMEAVATHSKALGAQLIGALSDLPGVDILGGGAPLDRRIGLVTFSAGRNRLPAEMIARQLYDRYQILVSGGYHCAHILHHRLQMQGTVRVSTHVFNTSDDIVRLIEALHDVAGL